MADEVKTGNTTGEDQPSGGSTKKTNNLNNMQNVDNIYKFEAERIMRLLDKDAQAVYESVKEIPLIAADIFYAYYSPKPNLVDRNGNQLLEAVRSMLSEYMKTDDYKALHEKSQLNENVSLAYAAEVMRNLLKQMQQAMQQQMGQQGNRNGKGQSLQDLMESARQGDQTAKQKLDALLREALRKKHRSATKEMIGESMDLAGKEVGSDQRTNPLKPKQVDQTQQILTTTKKLVQSIPKLSNTNLVRGPFGDRIAGYKLTKNIAKALPKEHAMPDDVFYAKIGEGWLALDKFTVKHGAYYVLVDKSGSMAGDKSVWARSVALALYTQASREGKKYYMRFFDDAPYKLREGSKDLVDAILRTNAEGGTSIDDALAMAVFDITHNKKFAKQTNTVIIITDGQDGLARDWGAELKKAGINVVSIMIQGNNEQLRAISNLYFNVEPTTSNALNILKGMRRKEERDKMKNLSH